MRYILTILISLLIFENLLAGNIKHRRIECSVDWDKERFKNIFFIISENQKTAQYHSATGFEYYKYIVDVSFDINEIKFTYKPNSMMNYTLNRSDGTLDGVFNNYSCKPLPSIFSPEAFLKGEIKINLEKKRKENKF